jgi:pimeloyl-ACP methyl ester carboxylesterase
MPTSNIKAETRRNRCSVGLSIFALILLASTLAGCARLAPGQFAANAPEVYLVRGYLDWYSTGIDQLTTELKSDGQSAAAFREEQWADVADHLSAHPQQPLMLIGFSYGADDVIRIARRLNDVHQPVELLITIDPVTPADIPPNVKRCVNFYQPNGFWDLFPWLRGVPVSKGENINIRARPDLIEPNTSHATIAGNEKVHTAIRQLVNKPEQ